MSLTSSSWNRGVFGWSLRAQVIWWYSIVILGAGHGAAPAGLLLVLGARWVFDGGGTAPWVLFAVICGWLGVLTSGLTLIPPLFRRARWLTLLGVLALSASVLGIVMSSEVMPLTLLTAVPFLVSGTLLVSRSGRRSEASPPKAGESVP